MVVILHYHRQLLFAIPNKGGFMLDYNPDQVLDQIHYSDARNMSNVPDETVDLIVTSPPYFNIKDYAKDGRQQERHSPRTTGQIGDCKEYSTFISELLKVWKECERVLKPNGKIAINVPLVPMKKRDYTTHYNRHIFDLNADIQHSILNQNATDMYLYDTYIWKRTNASKSLMFGSYPYPRNFYAQNSSEFITVYVKDGQPINNSPETLKIRSKLTQDEWVEFTKQIWEIAIPNKGDIAFGKHSAIMPEEIIYRCLRLFTFEGDVVLDPFAGSGTTLKVAKQHGRRYIGFEIMKEYQTVIEAKLNSVKLM